MPEAIKRSFPWVSFLKRVAVLAIPVALQNLLTTTGSMVDTMMIAPLGENTVGAIGLCAQFTTLMFSAYWGFAGGGILFYSQYWGAKDDKGISRAYGITMCCLMTVAFIFAGLALFAPEFIMSVYTDKESIQEIGIQYLQIVGLAYPMQVFSVGMSGVLRSTGKVKLPLYASLASVATNVLMNWILIYGKLGLPAMGVRGAALATVISAFVNFIVILIVAKITGFKYLFTFRDHFRWEKKWLGMYFKKCFPIICNEFLIGVGNMVINMVLGRQSEPAIAATAVMRTLEGLVVGFFAGFSSASSILVGNDVGAGKLDSAYAQAIRLVYLCGGCIFLLCVTPLLLLHKPILTALSLSGESFEIGTQILIVYSVISILRMCNWIQNDTFRSAGDASYGTILEICGMYIILIPAVCLAGLKLRLAYPLVFMCCYLDEPVRFVLMQLHTYSGKWIKPVTPQGTEALPAFREKHSKQSKTTA